jgi:competence protein ComEA
MRSDASVRSIDVSGSSAAIAEALRSRRRAVAALVVVALSVILIAGMRGAPAVEVAPPASAPPSSVATPAMLVVHVAGAVRHPGLYELPAGTRVADAIEAAGGPTAKADLDAVNLAQPVVDGSQIEVPTRGALPIASASAAPGSLVSINSADVTTLETIPGIGPVKAAAIVGYRDEIGAFTSLDELMQVSGIGPATLESIRPYVTL